MLKAPCSAFTIENLWRHCDKLAFKHSKWVWKYIGCVVVPISRRFVGSCSAGRRVRGLWLRDRWSWDGDQRAERSIDENWTDECRSAQISQSRDPAPSPPTILTKLFTLPWIIAQTASITSTNTSSRQKYAYFVLYLHLLFAANFKEGFHYNEWITRQHINF